MSDGTRQTGGRGLRLAQPELTLTPRGEGSDPRLVELVRLLARRAARECYEEQVKDRRKKRS
ncbi:hypothetical protein PZN02_001959 [Sinorhizobium garamanticum]|uniref:Transposase n=1 Tax=Sinorhizobium garamanticum TaxID=680247 RepID=A0ABY8D4D3_9HYPH|nr:hypothetical protein [Sinorhizobium garamanticum]WEX85731.1 hypothetical protein PZN02_001959 [Sinorhizobium garamanticum]